MADEHRSERAAAGQIGMLRRDLGGHRAIVPARLRDVEGSARLSAVREWTVAGGLLETPDGVLLVRNIAAAASRTGARPAA